MKKTTSLATALAVGLTIMGSSLCQAQGAPDKKQKQFDKLDADKNGSLSLEEYTSKVKTPERTEAFTARDTDKNGALTLQEFSTPPAKKVAE
jgi:Ca2+-binding EF-hand superfamily protein